MFVESLPHEDRQLIALLHYAADSNGMMGSMMQDLAFAIPGVDEAMSFAEIMKCVSNHCCTPVFIE
jgi:anion-transporting  ArsA/GET3 family ATPase